MFSAGFYPAGDNAYYFGIWFSQNWNHSVVWMANRDQPVNGRLSKLSLLKDGNLILIDAGRNVFWSTNTVSSSLSHLHLYDTGNLVLRTSEGIILWQSFDSPTDTLLPQQGLTRYIQLISSRSQTNHSSGFYKLFFDDDNVLRLVYNGPDTSSIYWPRPWLLSNQANRSRYNDTRIAVFDSSGHFISSDRVEFRAADFGAGPWRRLTLDFDGNLRLYTLEENTRNWVVSWQAISKPCRIHGVCGSNSLCSNTYEPGYGRRRCSCLPGFNQKNDTDWSYGCEPSFPLTCKRGESTFLKLPHADFYGYNIRILRNYTLKMCKKTCLKDCNCKGFHYRANANGVYSCYPKRVFRNGHRSPDFVGDLYVKRPKSSTDESVKEMKLVCSRYVWQLHRTYLKRNENGLLKYLLYFAYAVGCIEMICILLVWCLLCRSRQGSGKAMEGYILAITGFNRFTYTELKKATRGFREEIGRGGGGIVYKGTLSDGRTAAIKRLNEANQGEAEFLAEIGIIGRLNHMNLIEMWGYCAQGKHRLLVYEYMENGSLAENLYSNKLDWDKRFEIAVSTAKGLAYLHEECLEWVLHCDVKPQNILLDSNYMPKVADFGLSKLVNRCGNNSSFSKIRGTRGYMAPEWIFNLPITSKVDVYSYGVVVLEMVTGKSPTTGVHDVGGAIEEEQRGLINWVRDKVNRDAATDSWIENIVDIRMGGEFNADKMQVLVDVALQCVEEDKNARPTMTEVLQMLQSHENDY